MKHATAAALAKLAGLLDEIRSKGGINERKPGILYRKSRAFLHFHEDPAGLFADLRAGPDFGRYPVNTPGEREILLSAVARALKFRSVDRNFRLPPY